MVRRGEGARERLAPALGFLPPTGDGDGLLEPALEERAETLIGHPPEPRQIGARGEMVAMNRGNKEQRADAFVEIALATPVGVECVASGQEFGGCAILAPGINRQVAR